MNSAIIIFPHQLYSNHPALSKSTEIYLVEEWLYFKQYPFHKQKIWLHRASMKYYQSWLTEKKHKVHYIDATQPESDIRLLIKEISDKKISKIIFCDPSDDWLLNRIINSSKKHKLQTEVLPNPNFITDLKEANLYFDQKKNYFQTDFYIRQRKTLNILLDDQQKPLGGKWTFDAENREKLPKKISLPTINLPKENQWTKEAVSYVNTNFTDHYGSIDKLYYPITYEEAQQWLDQFLSNRFEYFGKYEDAMNEEENFLFHSVLTPMLNIGLLSPKEIIEKSLAYATKKNIPLNSSEGFIRQIIGWREFIHIVYRREGSKQRTTNYWQFKRKIPASFWNGTTGIIPIDKVIQKVLQTGYCHHIERLMILGNFMLLCEFDPDEVYRWFMEMFVDAYDWVMVPNVYGMTQFADGGMMTTKPYISGSNYLLKMGNWQKGDWCAIWDGLFWHFMDKQRAFFSQNPRLGMLLKTFDKMPEEKRNQHLKNARSFLTQLDNYESA